MSMELFDVAKKLTKLARREQLLDTALNILAADGTESLTLSSLADAAGVTKPITYEHFRTREGLLLALFRRFDDKTAAQVKVHMQQKPTSLEAVVDIVVKAYVSCFISAGPVFGLILDALSASPETGGFRSAWRDELALAIAELVKPYGVTPLAARKDILVGLLGAAEAISATTAQRQMTQDAAERALKDIMLASLRFHQT